MAQDTSKKPKKPAPPDIKEDYQAVRAEILQWQNYRFLTLTATGVVVSAFLTIVNPRSSSDGTEQLIVFSSNASKVLALLGLLLFLACAMAITLYAGRGNGKMGTYLMVFYEERREVAYQPKKNEGEKTRGVGWESRHGVFRDETAVPGVVGEGAHPQPVIRRYLLNRRGWIGCFAL